MVRRPEMSNYALVVLPKVISGPARDVQNVPVIQEWFSGVFPVRMEVVQRYLKSELAATFLLTEEYLQKAATVYLSALPYRKRTLDEMAAIREQLPTHIQSVHKVPSYELVEPAFSMLFDLGILWGEVLRSSDPNLGWHIETELGLPSTGLPVLYGPASKSRLCPIQVLLNCARQNIEGRLPADGILKYHHNWLRLL